MKDRVVALVILSEVLMLAVAGYVTAQMIARSVARWLGY